MFKKANQKCENVSSSDRQSETEENTQLCTGQFGGVQHREGSITSNTSSKGSLYRAEKFKLKDFGSKDGSP
jgi:hypothetical protein